MTQQMFPHLSGLGRHYASYQRAVKSAESVGSPIRFIIAAGTIENTGAVRFFPVFLPTEEQTQAAVQLAHAGYHVCRV